MTECPSASSASQRCEPRKPAPPVTKMRNDFPEDGFTSGDCSVRWKRGPLGPRKAANSHELSSRAKRERTNVTEREVEGPRVSCSALTALKNFHDVARNDYEPLVYPCRRRSRSGLRAAVRTA